MSHHPRQLVSGVKSSPLWPILAVDTLVETQVNSCITDGSASSSFMIKIERSNPFEATSRQFAYLSFVIKIAAKNKELILVQSQIQITNMFVFSNFTVNNELLRSSLFHHFIRKSLNNEHFCFFGQNLGHFLYFHYISDNFGQIWLILGLLFANCGNSRLISTNFSWNQAIMHQILISFLAFFK